MVLDAWPLVGLMLDDDCAGRVEKSLRRALQDRTVIVMTTTNWGEVVYSTAVRRSHEVAEVVADLERIPVELIPVDRDRALVAARLKAERRLAYADALAAALALALDAPLMTGDHDFRELLPELPLEWVGE